MKNPTINISASQLANFRDGCPRKWAFEKLDGLARPATKATNDGLEIHRQVEEWYKAGVPPTSKAALALLAHLPAPSNQVKAEYGFNFNWPGLKQPVLVRGFIDLLRLDDEPTVFDHKTGSSLRYAKTEADLRVDPQVLIYGIATRLLMAESTGQYPKNVGMQWTYVVREDPKTRAPATQKVEITQSLVEMKEQLDAWTPTVEQIVKAHEVPSEPETYRALKILPNVEGCFKFGPCPYKEVCPDFSGKPEPVIQERGEIVSLDFLNQLLATKKATPAPAPAPTPSVIEEVAHPEIQGIPVFDPPQMGLLDALEAAEENVPWTVSPPDSRPNVSFEEPAPPPIIEEPKKKGIKAKSVKTTKSKLRQELIDALTEDSEFLTELRALLNK